MSLEQQNTHRFLLYAALALNFSAASAADRYGEWLLEQQRSFVLTLSSRQSLPLNNKIATSELGLICNQKDKYKSWYANEDRGKSGRRRSNATTDRIRGKDRRGNTYTC